ncbi:TIGR02436: four helix bundle protein [compost metagenome]
MDFERLEVWQRARQLAVQVFQALRDCRDYGFRDQVGRSALSVPSNVAEGMERGSGREKCHSCVSPRALVPSYVRNC